MAYATGPYAKPGDEFLAKVIRYEGSRAVCELPTLDDEAFIVGTYPSVGSTVRVIVETAANPHEHMKRTRRYITAVEIAEPSESATFWRAPDVATPTLSVSKSSTITRPDGRVVKVERVSSRSDRPTRSAGETREVLRLKPKTAA